MGSSKDAALPGLALRLSGLERAWGKPGVLAGSASLLQLLPALCTAMRKASTAEGTSILAGRLQAVTSRCLSACAPGRLLRCGWLCSMQGCVPQGLPSRRTHLLADRGCSSQAP